MNAPALLAADPVTGLGHLLAVPYIQHALLAGSAIALLSGLVGFFVVLRGQVFAADALSHVAYAGSLAALAAGVDLRFGLFAACIAVGAGARRCWAGAESPTMSSSAPPSRGSSASASSSSPSTRPHRPSGDSAANVNVLFGSIFGISAGDARFAAWIALGGIAVLVAIARPLLFASLDPASPRRVACPSACSGRCSSRSWASPRPRPARRSARCCCSLCWLRPRRPPSC